LQKRNTTAPGSCRNRRNETGAPGQGSGNGAAPGSGLGGGHKRKTAHMSGAVKKKNRHAHALGSSGWKEGGDGEEKVTARVQLKR